MEMDAERALKAAVPTGWVKAGGVAFAVVKFPRETEPGEWWMEKTWVAVPWIFGNGLFGVEVTFVGDARFTAIACPQYGERLAEVEELHVLLNTEPIVGLQLHDEAVQWLRGWAMALQKEAVKRKAVEKARLTEHCRLYTNPPFSLSFFVKSKNRPFEQYAVTTCRFNVWRLTSSAMDKTGTRCPACGGPLVTDYERGEVVCIKCGLVVAEAAVDTGPEWRSFDKEKRDRSAPLKLVIKTDMAAKLEHGARWRMLAKFHREALHGHERRLVKIGGEIRRIRECVGLPQSVVEEAESLVKKYFNTVVGFPAEVVAVAVLWAAAKAAGAPRPLDDFLKCGRADKHKVWRAMWRLKEAVKSGRRPSIDDYVKTLAARVNLPAPVVKSAVELLERNRRVLVGRNPWVSAAAALWLASLKKLGLLKALAEAAGSTPAGIRNAAKRLR